MSELWDLYDKDRNPLNKTHERGLPITEGEYHLVVDIWTVRSDGKILVDKRHPDKHLGGMWECTGGSVISGEDSITGALRELKEELGISVNAEDLKLIEVLKLKDRFVDTYVLIKDVKIKDLIFQENEVVEAKYVTLKELDLLCINNELSIRERYIRYRNEIEDAIKEAKKLT